MHSVSQANTYSCMHTNMHFVTRTRHTEKQLHESFSMAAHKQKCSIDTRTCTRNAQTRTKQDKQDKYTRPMFMHADAHRFLHAHHDIFT